MATATYELCVDWNDDGNFSGVNEDISAYVLRDFPLSVELGRDYPSQMIGKSVAGKLECTLLNTDGRFSPFYAAGPLYGNLQPGRRVRLRATFNAVTYAVFQGFLESINPSRIREQPNIATLTALGIFSKLNKDDVKVSMQTNVATGTAIGEVLDKIGWPAGDRVIDTGQTTMTRWWSGGVEGLTALHSIENTEGGFNRETKDGKFAFEDRYHRLKGAHLVSQCTFSDAGGASLSYKTLSHADPFRESFGIITAEVRTYNVLSLAVLWTCPESGANSPAIEAGAIGDFWAGYPNPVTGATQSNAVAVDAWTTPVATTDFTANSRADGLGSNLTASIGIAATKFDNAMKITLTNNAAVTAYITFLQARGTAVTVNDPIIIKAEDATSIAYPKTYQLPATGIPTTAEAQARTNFELGIRRGRLSVVSVDFLANTSDNHMVQALNRDVSDRLTLVASTAAKLGINGGFFIERIRHLIVKGEHRVSWDCSDADAYAGFIVLDTGPGLDSGKLAS